MINAPAQILCKTQNILAVYYEAHSICAEVFHKKVFIRTFLKSAKKQIFRTDSPPACNFTKSDTLVHMFCSEFLKKSTPFE